MYVLISCFLEICSQIPLQEINKDLTESVGDIRSKTSQRFGQITALVEKGLQTSFFQQR